MRERRRSGWLVLPATRPPADRAWLGLSAGCGHHRHPSLVRVISAGPEETAEPATAAPPD